MYVADGNFKADHVRQSRSDREMWLWDGAGMMPNRLEYKAFLSSAQERHTVFHVIMSFLGLTDIFRKRPVKINSGPSSSLF